MNAYELASLAGVPSPDSLDSEGACFLLGVHDDWHEAANELRWTDEERSDVAHELADAAVYEVESRGTHRKWLAFVDLAAYREDIEDLGFASQDINDRANVALYVIAERLLLALCDEEG